MHENVQLAGDVKLLSLRRMFEIGLQMQICGAMKHCATRFEMEGAIQPQRSVRFLTEVLQVLVNSVCK